MEEAKTIEFKNEFIGDLHNSLEEILNQLKVNYKGSNQSHHTINVMRSRKQLMMVAAQCWPEDRLAIFNSIGHQQPLNQRKPSGGNVTRPNVIGRKADNACADCPDIPTNTYGEIKPPSRIIKGPETLEKELGDQIEEAETDLTDVVGDVLLQMGKEDVKEENPFGAEITQPDANPGGQTVPDHPLSTKEAVIKNFGSDEDMIKDYCHKNKIPFHHANKMETIAQKIADFHSNA